MIDRISRLLDEIGQLDLGDEEAARLLDGMYVPLRQVRAHLKGG
jgi:hypothetical protein